MPIELLGPKSFFVTGLVLFLFVTDVAKTSLPGSAWVVLITFCNHLFRAQYIISEVQVRPVKIWRTKTADQSIYCEGAEM